MLSFMNAVHTVEEQVNMKNFTWPTQIKSSYYDSNQETSIDFRLGHAIGDSESSCRILLESLKHIQIVDSMQSLINDIFGPIIALNSALMVFLCCALFYMYITITMGALGELGTGAATGTGTWWDVLDFWGNAVVAYFIFIRFVFVFMTLGNVHNASVKFNATMAKTLLSVRNPQNSELNLILATVTMNSINPISFNAGGYFVYSRSTFLTTISIIATYLIFLLQAT